MLAGASALTGEQIEHRIAKRLARLRADHGWSLEELSERTGFSRASLSRLERSELSPTAGMLGKLSRPHPVSRATALLSWPRTFLAIDLGLPSRSWSRAVENQHAARALVAGDQQVSALVHAQS